MLDGDFYFEQNQDLCQGLADQHGTAGCKLEEPGDLVVPYWDPVWEVNDTEGGGCEVPGIEHWGEECLRWEWACNKKSWAVPALAVVAVAALGVAGGAWALGYCTGGVVICTGIASGATGVANSSSVDEAVVARASNAFQVACPVGDMPGSSRTHGARRQRRSKGE